MNQSNACTLFRWIQRVDPFFSIRKIFERSYDYSHGQIDDSIIRYDLGVFAVYGHVPYYVLNFVAKNIYPKLLLSGNRNSKKSATIYHLRLTR